MTDDNTDEGGDYDNVSETEDRETGDEDRETGDEDSVDEPLYDESNTVEIDIDGDDFRDLSPADGGDDAGSSDSDTDHTGPADDPDDPDHTGPADDPDDSGQTESDDEQSGGRQPFGEELASELRRESTPRDDSRESRQKGDEPGSADPGWDEDLTGDDSGTRDTESSERTQREVPLSELAAEVKASSEASAAADASSGALDDDPLFEEVDTSGPTAEEAWERLEREESFERPETSASSGAEAVSRQRPEYDVDKRLYCQQCPYLSEPPELHCTHDGTEIVKIVDSDHFRVRSCPMIGEEGPSFEDASDS